MNPSTPNPLPPPVNNGPLPPSPTPGAQPPPQNAPAANYAQLPSANSDFGLPPQQPLAGQPLVPLGAASGNPVVPGTPPPVAIAPRINPNSTQNALQIAEIRDGLVIMNDGSFRSVIMVKSINFDLMSPQEREAVEFSYQGFLNSLYFPIQIFIHSRKVDLGPYIDKLDKIRTEHENMLLALLMEDYITFMDQIAQQTNIMDKKFYLVIPYFPTVDVQKALTASKNLFTGVVGLFNNKPQHVVINEPDLEKAKAELRNRVQATLAGLMQCGVQGLPLATQELIELYYDVYNPDTATRQELKNFNDLSAPVVTKGEGMAPQPNLDKELQ
ncbi:MAG TPA: hypothetical protein VLF90_01755 [Patescibacteria group bacterium]|nr:hypothetical protein [Patescibacteria group bacterium]